MTSDAYNLLGQNGWTLIDDTDADSNGPYIWLEAVGGSAEIANATSVCSNSTGFDTNITLAQGQGIGGEWTTVDLANGAVVAYKSRRAARQ